MSNTLKSESIQCPYCGEILDILIDRSVSSQAYIEDCQICCRPIEIAVETDLQGQVVHLSAKHEND